MKKCSKCVLPDSYPGIEFDAAGVCNQCSSFKLQQTWGREKLDQAVAKHRSKGKYDCILALSGGRDSSYAAWYVVKQMGLKPLAYTFDNGYMPELTRRNIKETVKRLELDHITLDNSTMPVSLPPTLKAWLKKPSAAMIPFLCSGCASGYILGQRQLAVEKGIGLVISGGGEPESSFAERLLTGELRGRKKSTAMITGFLREVLRNPAYLSPRCLHSFYREFRYRYKKHSPVYKNLQLFLYIEWDEKEIEEVIGRELDWKRPDDGQSSWRSDCVVHLIKQLFYLHTLGFTKNEELLSAMIRSGRVSREEALARLVHENRISVELLEPVFRELGIDPRKVKESLDTNKHPM